VAAEAVPPGIYGWFGLRLPFADRMQLIREAGFTATSVWWEEDHPEGRRLRHHAPDMARAAGLELDSVHAPYRGCNRLWSENDDDRQAAVAEHVRWVQDCARHGVRALVMHVAQGGACPPPGDAGLDSLRRIVEVAEEGDVRIAIENTRRVEHIEYALGHIESPHLGLCYDTSHDVLYSPQPLAILERWRHRLVTAHLNDTNGRRDYHWLPGEGVVDFDAVSEYMPWPHEGIPILEVVCYDKDTDALAFLQDAWRAYWVVVRGETAKGHPP